MQQSSATIEDTTSIDVACDVCGMEFDPSAVDDTTSSTLCPCCTSSTRRTHGVQLRFARRR
jgi:hypothetical protein